MARAPAPPAPRADDQCSQAAGQAQLRAEWVIVQVGAGQPKARGLPRGAALLVATRVPHDPHMAVHALEDQSEDSRHLVVHQRGGAAWLKEHVTTLQSWASTIARAEIRLHDHTAISPGDTRALSVDQLTPQPPGRPVALSRPQRGVAQPHRVLLDPGGLGPHLF